MEGGWLAEERVIFGSKIMIWKIGRKKQTGWNNNPVWWLATGWWWCLMVAIREIACYTLWRNWYCWRMGCRNIFWIITTEPIFLSKPFLKKLNLKVDTCVHRKNFLLCSFEKNIWISKGTFLKRIRSSANCFFRFSFSSCKYSRLHRDLL